MHKLLTIAQNRTQNTCKAPRRIVIWSSAIFAIGLSFVHVQIIKWPLCGAILNYRVKNFSEALLNKVWKGSISAFFKMSL